MSCKRLGDEKWLFLIILDSSGRDQSWQLWRRSFRLVVSTFLSTLTSYLLLFPFYFLLVMNGAVRYPQLLEADERLPAVVAAPAVATGMFYLLPHPFQTSVAVQFVPQLVAYGSFVWWIGRNDGVLARLGLRLDQVAQGLRWGVSVGLVLGLCNSWIILRIVPWLGADIQFLKQTPHAQVPPALMLPWFIALIATLVELNFRGFQLGRWLGACRRIRSSCLQRAAPIIAVVLSAIIFAFDPFLVMTFRHLHWIAVWDALIWGTLYLLLRNLYATMIAHAVEVMIMYAIVRITLT